MRYLSINTWKVKCEAKSNWHRWFAWYPVTVKKYPDGARYKVWWKTVLRKGELLPNYYPDFEEHWIYEYKEVSQ